MSRRTYWGEFYQKDHTYKPSNFAELCLNFIKPKSKIIEFGCGNGRDTYFFGWKKFKIKGIDSAIKPKNEYGAKFIQSDLTDYIKKYENKSDVVYARFFLHSINGIERAKFLNWATGLVCLEFRAKDDTPIVYKDHYRNIIDENALLQQMLVKKYDIIYYSKSRGVAIYKDEDPLIVRIIARRK